MALRRIRQGHCSGLWESWITVDTETYAITLIELTVHDPAGIEYEASVGRQGGPVVKFVAKSGTSSVSPVGLYHGRGRQSTDHGNYHGITVAPKKGGGSK